MHIGERIRRFRGEIRWSQSRFAVTVGISQVFVSCLERGAVQPSKELVARIEKAMKIIRDSERAADEARKRVLDNLNS